MSNAFSILLLVSFLQYLFPAVEMLISGNVILFQADDGFVADAGLLKYGKDIFILLCGIYWPIFVNKTIKTFPLVVYLAWLFLLLLSGLFGAILAGNVNVYYIGIRWILLLHVCVGISIIGRSADYDFKSVVLSIRIIVLLAILNVIAVIWQSQYIGGLSNIGVGGYRLAGLFSGSGALAYFGLGLSIIIHVYKLNNIYILPLLGVCGLFMTVAAGWRHAQIAAVISLSVYSYSFLKILYGEARVKLLMPFLLMAGIFLSGQTVGYMLDRTDRGGFVSEQAESGGRISNLQDFIRDTGEADVGIFLFGAGLGVGTNSLHAYLLANNKSETEIKYHRLIDNTFITLFIQFGLIGCIIFAIGFSSLIRPLIYKFPPMKKFILFLVAIICSFAQNVFEQTYLMIFMAHFISSDSLKD